MVGAFDHPVNHPRQLLPVITLETYAHLWPGEDDRTRDVMDAALSPLADSLRTRGA